MARSKLKNPITQCNLWMNASGRRWGVKLKKRHTRTPREDAEDGQDVRSLGNYQIFNAYFIVCWRVKFNQRSRRLEDCSSRDRWWRAGAIKTLHLSVTFGSKLKITGFNCRNTRRRLPAKGRGVTGFEEGEEWKRSSRLEKRKPN